MAKQTKHTIPVKRGRPPSKTTRGSKGGAASIPTDFTQRTPKVVQDAVKTAKKAIGTKGGAAIAGGAAGLIMGATLMGIAGMAANRRIKRVSKTAQHAADVLSEQAHDLEEVLTGKKK